MPSRVYYAQYLNASTPLGLLFSVSLYKIMYRIVDDGRCTFQCRPHKRLFLFFFFFFLISPVCCGVDSPVQFHPKCKHHWTLSSPALHCSIFEKFLLSVYLSRLHDPICMHMYAHSPKSIDHSPIKLCQSPFWIKRSVRDTHTLFFCLLLLTSSVWSVVSSRHWLFLVLLWSSVVCDSDWVLVCCKVLRAYAWCVLCRRYFVLYGSL